MIKKIKNKYITNKDIYRAPKKFKLLSSRYEKLHRSKQLGIDYKETLETTIFPEDLKKGK